MKMTSYRLSDAYDDFSSILERSITSASNKTQTVTIEPQQASSRFYLSAEYGSAQRGVAAKLRAVGHDILTINAIILGFGSNEKLSANAAEIFWSDRRIRYTVTADYVANSLPTTAEVDLKSWLNKPVAFGAGLTDETYLDWILNKARRLFLILTRIGIPEQIFGIIDDSWDDEDLPIDRKAVSRLALCPTPDDIVDEAFWKAQYTVLLRTLNRGSHIDYHEFETVPVDLVEHGVDYDKVAFPDGRYINRYFIRKTVDLTLDDVANHVSAVKSKVLSNPNIVELFASYTHNSTPYLLYYPFSRITLDYFMMNPAYLFSALPLNDRALVVFNWVKQLSTAVAYLHAQKIRHGDIRPSGVLVIDDGARVVLADPGQEVGLFDIFDRASHEVEMCEYAAPEIFGYTNILSSQINILTPPKVIKSSRSSSFGSVWRPASLRNLSNNSSSSSSSDGERSSSRNSITTIRPNFLVNNTLGLCGEASEQFCDTYKGFRYRSDVFPLGCVALEILVFLSPRRKLSQFKTARQRNASRGSSLPLRERISSFQTTALSPRSSIIDVDTRPTTPSTFVSSTSKSARVEHNLLAPDSAYHLNLSIIYAWCDTLLADAQRKDANKALKTMYLGLIPLIRSMLVESPEARRNSEQVKKYLQEMWELDFGRNG